MAPTRTPIRAKPNVFTAPRRDIPWRPVLDDGTGLRVNPKPTAPGSQSALVIGPNGETSPSGSGEIYTDGLGRIKVRFHWQQGETADDRGSCWLRVVSRSAGNGAGHHFIPRIGQEVLVGFLDNDIDRPIVLGALYNGQGEAGIAPSPGGSGANAADDASMRPPSIACPAPRATSPAATVLCGTAPAPMKKAIAMPRATEGGGTSQHENTFNDVENDAAKVLDELMKGMGTATNPDFCTQRY